MTLEETKYRAEPEPHVTKDWSLAALFRHVSRVLPCARTSPYRPRPSAASLSNHRDIDLIIHDAALHAFKGANTLQVFKAGTRAQGETVQQAIRSTDSRTTLSLQARHCMHTSMESDNQSGSRKRERERRRPKMDADYQSCNGEPTGSDVKITHGASSSRYS